MSFAEGSFPTWIEEMCSQNREEKPLCILQRFQVLVLQRIVVTLGQRGKRPPPSVQVCSGPAGAILGPLVAKAGTMA